MVKSELKTEPSSPHSGDQCSNASGTAPGGSATPTIPSAPPTVVGGSAKDPGRPRRKKARRACFACQRAHLTCGDERPCQRCIKRGLQDACHDGVRKKAKYLHDAPIDDGPPEFAVPPPSSTASTYAYQPAPPPPSQPTGDMLPPDGTINPNSIESPGNVLQDSPTQQQNFSGAPLFDPSDPALFNFDIASLNFGSQYGALEFGVLGQMGGQAAQDGPEGTSGGSNYGYSPVMPTAGESYTGYAAPQGETPQGYGSDNWAGNTRNNPAGNHSNIGGGFAGTYMIEAGPGSLTSPSPPVESPRQGYVQNTSQGGGYPDTPTTGPMGSPGFYQHSNHRTTAHPQHSSLQQVQSASQPLQQIQRRRRLPDDPSQIYSTITAPYPYTLHYHRLFHMLESRFPKPLLLRIARAMASFRPSFIACTQTLKAEDLLFMEKCFQRTLWEYERFIQSCGTPTLVCRRTGEVVGVGKEFCMLTGWEKPILLGERPNLNTNVPTHTSVPNLPPPPLEEPGLGGQKKPVFLAELLDDESVVEFYEQFARLAFGDSRGAVMTTCKVLKYRPPRPQKQPNGSGAKAENGDSDGDAVGNRGPKGMDGLGAKDGKVECAFCWTIKRDVFDIPMLIVGNFLPILHGQQV
ncbi:hypothetical protein P167DRAFT_544625 [Morchella conica CCBAS932]|uniref:Zn(2)-C6 fungal-type domain-containing protein n=1 Tax=Morchella conica CCBAS932 TaxID=1392247 RepID=A0A3N4KT22_9PEZI|nr:hypothetical protein P167DRAFT_544625 [Morchella conica CCBAS932]